MQAQLACTAPARQSLPQAPQLCTSVLRSGWLVSTPSQFESTLQASCAALGPIDPTHWIVPPTQALAPATHGDVAPAGAGGGTLHAPTLSGGGALPILSMAPSQSSSWPL